MESLWKKETELFSSDLTIEEVLSKKKSYEIIVVGGGLAGLLCAYYLKEQGKSVLVVEAKTIASGQSGRTTAKITSQHGLKYSKLIEDIGVDRARLYAQAHETAIREYERLITDCKIECEFERVPAYLYSVEDEHILKKEAEAARQLGIDAYFTEEVELPFMVKGAVCFRNQAQFSPLKFMKYLASDLDILENTKVLSVKGHEVFTEKGNLEAGRIVLATHYPVLNVPGFYFLRQHQERSYVLALSGCPLPKGIYYGVDQGGFSFRRAGDFLLFGGGAHRTGENVCGGKYEELIRAARKYFPDCRETARWSAQDCMPHDGIPFIGRYSAFTPELYVITGFGKWGMTSAMIAAMILRDELYGVENMYAELFRPQRVYLKAGYKNFITDVGMSIKGLARGWLWGSKCKPYSRVYGSEEGEDTVCREKVEIPKRCSHMGCELIWNPDEESWDCPCHGSRFTGLGKLLDNPSQKDVSVK